MVMMRAAPCVHYWLALFTILICCHSTTAAATANLSTTWTINSSSISDRSDFFFRTVLTRNAANVNFISGIHCIDRCSSYIFSVFITPPNISAEPRVVWSANRDRPVSKDAELSLTASGELVLRDVDGSAVWSTNSTGKSVAGLNLTHEGNLVLFDTQNSTVWQSFDYPTDCLLPGQRLFEGYKLIPRVSTANLTTQNGLFSLQVTDKGLFGYVGSNPHQVYARFEVSGEDRNKGRRYVRFLNGSLVFFIRSVEPGKPDMTIDPDSGLLLGLPTEYMQLMPNGHLQVFQWEEWEWLFVNLLDRYRADCSYPMACGRNGLCLEDWRCTCPAQDYFRPVSDRQPDLGCSEITPLTCNHKKDHELITVENVLYSNQVADLQGVDIKTCKQACVNNCSCKAALFRYGSNTSDGDCFLPFELFTMTSIDPKSSQFNGTAFLKVQKLRLDPNNSRIILISTCASAAFVLGVVGLMIYIIRRRRRAAEIEEQSAEMEEESIRNIQGMPTRFAYEQLKTATDNFTKKLGEGGFGAVFEGTLEDGSKIAVKCLEGLGQVKKSLLAEVESIGSIHHVNLVRLVGFCAWKTKRFLVYEFMSNGSLDRWIHHGVRERVLEWKCRKNIILDVAKGLAYLHEDCRQKIIHLDIKPQNILLDSDFNAKVSDFGLSKLIDKNQSEVIVTMRGTPGYLAPEWLSSVITEKVDVYSFGIVLLETLCGRKKFDRSCPEDSWHLLDVFQKCWERGILTHKCYFPSLCFHSNLYFKICILVPTL